MVTIGQKAQFVVCCISFVIGLHLLLASSLFLDMDMTIKSANYSDLCGDSRRFRNLCEMNELHFTIGGVSGVMAGLIQIAASIAFIKNERPTWWCLTSGLVWILTTIAFAVPMNSRAYDSAVILRSIPVGTGRAMKIEFYLVMTALNMIFTLCGIVLLPKLAEHRPSPPPLPPEQPPRSLPEFREVLPSEIRARQAQRQLQSQDTRVQVIQPPPSPQSQAYPVQHPASGPLPS